MTKTQKQNLDNVVRYTLLTIWLLIVLFPLFWMVATSFKPDKDWLAWPPVYWSEEPTMSNYNNVWGGAMEHTETQYAQSIQKPFTALKNSTIISFISTFLSVSFGAFIAYGVSRYKVLSETRMFQLLMLRMVPPIVLVGPLSLYYTTIGL